MKTLIILAAFFLLSIPAFGQGSLSTGNPVAVNAAGNPLPNTLTAICTSNPGTTAPPCASLATIYTDITLGIACTGVPGSQPLNNASIPSVGNGCSNPGLTDGQGNVVAYAPAGTYWCQYYGPNLVTQVQPCIFPGTVGAWSAPGPIGSVTPNTGAFTNLAASTFNEASFVCGGITFWGVTDCGAQINAAYQTSLINPHIVVVGAGNNYSTPVTFTTLEKYPLLECLTPSSDSVPCLNYTPLTGAAITLDYASTSANPPVNQGMKNVTLANNGCMDTTGGCGGSAVGIQIGNTNGGDWDATYDGLSIYGFGGAGYVNTNNLAVNQNWTNFFMGSNALAYQYGAGVTSKFMNGVIAGNGQILKATAGGAPEIYMMNVNTFTNTGAGPAFDFTLSTLTGLGPAFFQCIQCHLESSGSTPNSHYISGVVDVYLSGGVAEDANPTGTGDWMFNTGGTDFKIDGTRILSARPYTNIILVNSPTRVEATPTNGSPTTLTDAMLFGGAGAVNSTGGWLKGKSSNAPSPRQFEYPFQFMETIPTPGAAKAGVAACYSDSTTHKLMCSFNNGSYFPATQTIGTGTSTSNGTAVNAGVSQAQPAITITGATITDVATCSLNAAPVATWQTGIQLLPPVVTSNTVTPWLSNPTAGNITPVAAVIRCTVTR